MGIQHEGAAVEHQLVLSADEVHIDMRQARLLHPRADDLLAQVFLVQVIRRRVGDQHHLRARRLGPGRGLGIPRVLAENHAEARALHVEHEGFAADLEVALLVEDLVVGQLELVILAEHTAVDRHGGGVGRLGQRAARRRRLEQQLRMANQHMQARESGQLGHQRIQRA